MGWWAHAWTPHAQAFVQFRVDQARSCAYKPRNSGFSSPGELLVEGARRRIIADRGRATFPTRGEAEKPTQTCLPGLHLVGASV
jgi:hypothetical protein